MARNVTFHGYVIDGNQRLKSAGTVAADDWQPFLDSLMCQCTDRCSSLMRKKKLVFLRRGFVRSYKNERGNNVAGSEVFDVSVTYTIGPESSLNGAGRSMPIG